MKTFSNALDVILKDQYIGKEWHLDFYVIGAPWCHKFALKVIENVMKMNQGNLKSKIHTFKYHYGPENEIKLANSAIFWLWANTFFA